MFACGQVGVRGIEHIDAHPNQSNDQRWRIGAQHHFDLCFWQQVAAAFNDFAHFVRINVTGRFAIQVEAIEKVAADRVLLLVGIE